MACEYNSSILTKPIRVCEKIKTPDDYGGYAHEFTERFAANASLTPISSKDVFFADRVEANTSHVCVIRYNSSIQSTDIILYGDRRFKIVGNPINVEEADRWLKIFLEEQPSP